MVLVVLFAYFVYPFPRRYHHVRNYLILAIEFLHVYDVVALMRDLAYLKYVSGTWRAIQHILMGISLLLVSFNVDVTKDLAGSVDICGRYFRAPVERGGNQVNNAAPARDDLDYDVHVRNMKEKWRRIIKLLTTMIFMNISFTVMRVRIKVEHKELDNGLIMVAKNCIKFILNVIY